MNAFIYIYYYMHIQMQTCKLWHHKNICPNAEHICTVSKFNVFNVSLRKISVCKNLNGRKKIHEYVKENRNDSRTLNFLKQFCHAYQKNLQCLQAKVNYVFNYFNFGRRFNSSSKHGRNFDKMFNITKQQITYLWGSCVISLERMRKTERERHRQRDRRRKIDRHIEG